MNKNLRKIAFLGIFTSLVIVMTAIPKIPVPQTNGYINLGDSMILLAVLFFGGPFGAIVGSFGSAIADVIGGFASFAPFTFVIKGVEALIFGVLIYTFKKKENFIFMIFSATIATAWMVAGYFIVEVFKFKIAAALAELPGNILQAVGSIIISLSLYKLLLKNEFIKNELKRGNNGN